MPFEAPEVTGDVEVSRGAMAADGAHGAMPSGAPEVTGCQGAPCGAFGGAMTDAGAPGACGSLGAPGAPGAFGGTTTGAGASADPRLREAARRMAEARDAQERQRTVELLEEREMSSRGPMAGPGPDFRLHSNLPWVAGQPYMHHIPTQQYCLQCPVCHSCSPRDAYKMWFTTLDAPQIWIPASPVGTPQVRHPGWWIATSLIPAPRTPPFVSAPRTPPEVAAPVAAPDLSQGASATQGPISGPPTPPGALARPPTPTHSSLSELDRIAAAAYPFPRRLRPTTAFPIALSETDAQASKKRRPPSPSQTAESQTGAPQTAAQSSTLPRLPHPVPGAAPQSKARGGYPVRESGDGGYPVRESGVRQAHDHDEVVIIDENPTRDQLRRMGPLEPHEFLEFAPAPDTE